MRKVIAILFLLAQWGVARAQVEQLPFSLGVGGGVDWMTNQDLSASPLTYRGFGLPLGINGFKLSEHWLSQFEGQAILPVLTNNYPLQTFANTNLLDWAKVSFRIQMLRRVGVNGRMFFGGEWKSSFFYRAYDFLDGYGYEYQNSLNLNWAQKIALGKKTFLLPQISMTLWAYINRKPSLTYDEVFLNDFNTERVSQLLRYGKGEILFDDWMAFEVDVTYHRVLSDKLHLQAKLGFNYYTIQFPEKVQHINIPIRCYLNYQF